ncbi:MAG TPA: DUF2127 domain-containing protein [Candidatus Limnocylindria bacterium]|nr:DUF2127 domain-containing protein [Candidatus Limnocylindria bacterium]
MASAGKRAPTLYSVIAFKGLKGIFFLLVAFSVYTLIDNNLPEDFRRVLHSFRMDPESKFWSHIAENLEKITPKNILWVASGTLLYACISLAEAIGLSLRQAWGGWLAIGEGAFFIPIEIFELAKHFRKDLAAVLVINTVIVVYLWVNRDRLFLHHTTAAGPKGSKKPKKPKD